MSKRPWIAFYSRDWLHDTIELSAEERGVYITMLMLCYERDGPLPGDMATLKKILQRNIDRFHGLMFNRVIPKLLDSFFYQDENGDWRQKRVEKELRIAEEFSEKQKRKSKERWENVERKKQEALINNDVADATAMPDLSLIQSQSQSQSHKDIGEKQRVTRCTRLTENWKLPDDYRKAALEKGLSESEIAKQAQRMLNWSLSNKNGVKRDWYRTWLNWIDDAPRSGSTQKPAGRDLRNVPDNLLSNDQYWAKRRQLSEA